MKDESKETATKNATESGSIPLISMLPEGIRQDLLTLTKQATTLSVQLMGGLQEITDTQLGQSPERAAEPTAEGNGVAIARGVAALASIKGIIDGIKEVMSIIDDIKALFGK